VVAVAAGRDAAHVDNGKARRGGLITDRGQLLGVILEVRDVQLVETAGADGLDRDRHILEIFLALLGGDDDFRIVRYHPVLGDLLGGRFAGDVRRVGVRRRRVARRVLREGRTAKRCRSKESPRDIAD